MYHLSTAPAGARPAGKRGMRKEDSILIGLCADPPRPFASASAIDWGYLLRASAANRLDGIVFNALDRLGMLGAVPEAARVALEERYRRVVETVSVHLRHAQDLAARFSAAGLRMAVLRGPALGLTIYPKPYLRPFHDLDLLVPREELAGAKEILAAAGFLPEAGLLPDRYFEKHHLHLRRVHGQTRAVAEIHWAFDHPYAPTLVEIGALLARGRPAGPPGAPLVVLEPADSLVTLCLHLRKHCVFLDALRAEEDFPSLLIGERALLWLADIDRAARGMDAAGWERARKRAREWSLLEALESCRLAAERVWSGGGREPGAAGLSRWERAAARRRIAVLRGEGGKGRFDRFLFGLRADTIFRPVRGLELAGCLFPPADYLRKRYGSGGPAARAAHAARITGRLLANAWDYARLRRRGKHPDRRQPNS